MNIELPKGLILLDVRIKKENHLLIFGAIFWLFYWIAAFYNKYKLVSVSYCYLFIFFTNGESTFEVDQKSS